MIDVAAPHLQLGIVEALFMLSTAFALPTIAVLTFAYFGGGLKRTEDARTLPVMEPDFDWWQKSAEVAVADPAPPAATNGPTDAPRAGDAR